MPTSADIVVTGLGLVTPIGIGREPFWTSLKLRRSGIGPITSCDVSGLPVHLAGEVAGFEPKQYVRQRKSLKIMSRTMQLGVAAAQLAWDDAGFAEGDVDPERVGTVYGVDSICSPLDECTPAYVGTQGELHVLVQRSQEMGFPLGMLRILPNLATCHVSIALDARGPTNTHHHGDVSSLMAISEAVRVIQRGAADVMIAGGASSLTDPFDWVRSSLMDELSRQDMDGPRVPRPFAIDRDGQVRGEGAGTLILESRKHAEARGANILASVLDYGEGFVSRNGGGRAEAMASAMNQALERAGLRAEELGHVNAHGLGTENGDRLEAEAIRSVFPHVPVTAPKSYFGNLAAASGAVEAAVTVLALANGELPVTLNVNRIDPTCSVNLVIDEPLVHETGVGGPSSGLVVNQTPLGQAAAVVFRHPD